MKQYKTRMMLRDRDCAPSTEVLLLADGRILVHNLTPAFAELLRELNPNDEQIQPRVIRIIHSSSRS
jgi:hypothetical protein